MYNNTSSLSTKFLLLVIDCYISHETLSTCLETTTTLERLKLSIETQKVEFLKKKIKNLTHLSIDYVSGIHPKYFHEFCKNNQTLKYLKIEFFYLHINFIDDIVKYLINLEYLSINNKDHYPSIYNMKKLLKLCKLKKLCLFDLFNSNESHEFIRALAEQNQLESLKLYGIKISLHVIDSLIIFDNLKELLIDNWHMTDEVISRLVKNMNSNLTHLTIGW